MPGSKPIGSLVIAAHNEASTLPHLLDVLGESARSGRIRVVVVANGCRDDTADVARSYDGVIVEELARANKIDALNRGDELSDDIFPRLYVDADAICDVAAIESLFEAASRHDNCAVAPRISRRVAGDAMVRAYFRALSRFPSKSSGFAGQLAGRAIYGASRTARSRFVRFPDVINDDGYFNAIYAPSERLVVDEAPVIVPAKETVSDLVAQLVRVGIGNVQLESWLALNGGDMRRTEVLDMSPRARARRLIRRQLDDPWFRDEPVVALLDASIYAAIQLTAAVRIRIALRRGGDVRWR